MDWTEVETICAFSVLVVGENSCWRKGIARLMGGVSVGRSLHVREASSGLDAILAHRETPASVIVADLQDTSGSIFVLLDWLSREISSKPFLVGIAPDEKRSMSDLCRCRLDLVLEEPKASEEIPNAIGGFLETRIAQSKQQTPTANREREKAMADSDQSLAHKISETVKPVLRRISTQKGVPQREIQMLENAIDALTQKASRENAVLENGLTLMEKEVLTAVQDGLSAKEISQKLTISAETVYSHIRSIRRKLKITNQGVSLKRFLTEKKNS